MDSKRLLTMWPPDFAEFSLVDESMALYRAPVDEMVVAEKGQESRLELGLVRTNDSTTSTLNNRKTGLDGGKDAKATCSEEGGELGEWPQVGKADTHLDVPTTVLYRDQVLQARNSSFTSSMTTLMEKSAVVQMPPTEVLPEKRYSRVPRNLRWTFLSVYRRLNFLVIIPNIIVMIVLGAQHNLFRLSPSTLATAVSANLTASVLIRQELVINLLFIIFGRLPHSFPLRIRRLSAKIYHLGGVHSGAGIAAVVWFAFFNVSVFNLSPHVSAGGIKIALWALTITLDLLLLSIVILAHPGLRARWHNTFEMVHRFAGWTTIALFWALFVILSQAQRPRRSPPVTTFDVLIHSPVFWMLIVITISIILPWLKLRRVAVMAEPLSHHAVRLHFTYTNVPLCAAPRMSDNPLKEWHAFAGIPEENGKGFSVLVSRAGDWTASIIRNPPTRLWVRGIPTRGVLNVAPIFKRLILVATGSGIGPIMSLFYARSLHCRILWSTPDPEATFTKDVIQTVHRADPDAVIINTTVSGRPDLISCAWELYKSFEAEAVFIISNPRVTRKFVYGLESRGVPTFAPVFDS